MPQPILVPTQRDGASGLTYSLFRLGHLLEMKLNQRLAPQHLTARQLSALLHIEETPGLSRVTLANMLQITPQAAGGLARRLDERGLITRTFTELRSPMTYSLTTTGRRRLEQAKPIAEDAAIEALSAISADTGRTMCAMSERRVESQ
jgi:DNA-binding MarR family transcriptional regulator